MSCADIEFVYKEDKNLLNPLYEKTAVNTSGLDMNFINSYLPMYFGKNIEDRYTLSINIVQEKTKSSVKTNQAASKLRYGLKFTYTLFLNEKNCVTFKKELFCHQKVIIIKSMSPESVNSSGLYYMPEDSKSSGPLL